MKKVTWGWFDGATARRPRPVTDDGCHPSVSGVSNDTFGLPSFGGAANDGQAQNIGAANFAPTLQRRPSASGCNQRHSRQCQKIVHPVRTDYNQHHRRPNNMHDSPSDHVPAVVGGHVGKDGTRTSIRIVSDFYAAVQKRKISRPCFPQGRSIRDDGTRAANSGTLGRASQFLGGRSTSCSNRAEWAETAVFIAGTHSTALVRDHAAPPWSIRPTPDGFDAVRLRTEATLRIRRKSDAIQGRCGFGPAAWC